MFRTTWRRELYIYNFDEIQKRKELVKKFYACKELGLSVYPGEVPSCKEQHQYIIRLLSLSELSERNMNKCRDGLGHGPHLQKSLKYSCRNLSCAWYHIGMLIPSLGLW